MTEAPKVQDRPPPARPRRFSRLANNVRTIAQAAVGDKVSAGRLRNVGWPYGLEAVVALVLLLSCVAALLALLSGPLRRGSVLIIATQGGSSTPVGLVWLIAFLVVVALALFTLAAMHGPWWLKILGFFVGAMLLAVWGVTGAAGTSLLPTALAGAAILGLIAFWIARGRRSMAWWEFPLLLGLYALPVGAVMAVMSANAENFGFEFALLLVEQTASLLGFLVLPAALVAGAAVAELTVAVTVAATRQAQLLAQLRWVYVAVTVLVVLRGVQIGFQLADLDPVEEGWLAIAPALGLAAGFGLVSWLMVRVGRRHDDVAVSELPDDLARVGVPIGVALVCVLLPVFAFLFGYQALFGLFPDVARSIDFDPSPVVDRITDAFRGAVGVVLIVIGTRLARRGRLGAAVILGCVGVVLLGLAMRLITGYRWALWIDPDALNLVATATVFVVLAWHLSRRSLTKSRAIAIGALLILSALFSYRDFVSDPIGALIGYSGVALVLFGLVWDFLTGLDWANGDSRRFPRPVRVLLAVTYTLLTVTILAYGSLVRSSSTAAELDAYAELGDLVFGTALLGAAFTTVLRTVRNEQPVG